jgi:tetratricopeptide (TPR) repeat protein
MRTVKLLAGGAFVTVSEICRRSVSSTGRQAMIRFLSATAVAATAATVAATLSCAQPAFAQDESDQRLGRVHFETSCNEAAQRRFDRAMRYQHSFWYRQAKEIFEDVAKADPECGMAYWGIALTLLNNPHGTTPASNLPLGLAAIEKAKAVGAKTQRERDYIDALAVMYVDYDKIDHGRRVQAYLKAMEALAARYPTDDEAQIAYAITLNVAASPADKTYVNQLKGAAILEPIFKRQPQHPGVAHYLIHLYDYPPIAEKGLDAAMRYSKIAPAAPHAQHMPSHIFTRVGHWKESIAANQASVRAAKADNVAGDQLHGQDYMVYAYLQLAQDKNARAVIDDMVQAANVRPDERGGSFALAASPARYMVERGDWQGAAELEVRPSNFPFVTATTHFARALGAARAGKPDAAKADIAKLAELRDKLRETKDVYWAEQVDIQGQVASAWLLYAQGNYDEALKALRAAADAEDKTEKSPVTPGPLAPARELYGAMLLERGMAKEALAAFEATLNKEPHRLGATLGAAKAAAALGDNATAHAHYAAAVALTENADPGRAEIAAARAFVAKAN